MRIISGKYKYRIINEVRQKTTRQTQSSVRESVFNMVSNISDKVVLDLFAGSGSYGLEALSRNAKFCYFNDISKLCITTMLKTFKEFKIDNYILTRYDYNYAINYYINKNIIFDYIFIDPPYNSIDYNILLHNLLKLCNNDSIIILEVKVDTKIDLEDFNIIKEKNYGIKNIYFIQK